MMKHIKGDKGVNGKGSERNGANAENVIIKVFKLDDEVVVIETNNFKDTILKDTRKDKNRDLMEYDLVFLDHMMPKMDGYEFIEVLKNDEMYMDIPIIVMSSISKDEAMKKLGKLKIDSYMQKDLFNQTEFTKKVREILTKYHI